MACRPALAVALLGRFIFARREIPVPARTSQAWLRRFNSAFVSRSGCQHCRGAAVSATTEHRPHRGQGHKCGDPRASAVKIRGCLLCSQTANGSRRLEVKPRGRRRKPRPRLLEMNRENPTPHSIRNRKSFMKPQLRQRFRRFQLQILSYGNCYYVDRIADLETALAKKPRLLQIDIVGVGEISPDAALRIRAAL